MSLQKDIAGLAGKVAVVTGASRGIGFACAKALADAGVKVAITGRDKATLEKAKAQLPADTLIFAGDAADEGVANACLAEVKKVFGRVDILVNNAGGTLKDGAMLELPMDVIDQTLRFNLRGPLVWIRAAWNDGGMKDTGGVVLNMSSLGGISLQPLMGAYNTAKAGLNHMTRILAAELGPRVRVNAIAPGLIRTDATAHVFAHEASLAPRSPMGRLGEPQDISNAVLFLVSDASSWITGETLAVDGGALVQWGKIKGWPPAANSSNEGKTS
jgi:NAD(P)-dependent dehydrogenase (short-subunit alcohol dehydrogenase family)